MVGKWGTVPGNPLIINVKIYFGLFESVMRVFACSCGLYLVSRIRVGDTLEVPVRYIRKKGMVKLCLTIPL